LASDSISYDIKFIIVTDANVTPVWKVVRFTTPSSPAFLDTNRTRTHDLLITIGPGATTTVKDANGKTVKDANGIPVTRTVGPSASASNSHLAQEIGNAVAAALRTQLTSP
jgi:acyl-CoA synthetase (NDP forming)